MSNLVIKEIADQIEKQALIGTLLTLGLSGLTLSESLKGLGRAREDVERGEYGRGAREGLSSLFFGGTGLALLGGKSLTGMLASRLLRSPKGKAMAGMKNVFTAKPPLSQVGQPPPATGLRRMIPDKNTFRNFLPGVATTAGFIGDMAVGGMLAPGPSIQMPASTFSPYHQYSRAAFSQA